jgi:hypothetical protein
LSNKLTSIGTNFLSDYENIQKIIIGNKVLKLAV